MTNIFDIADWFLSKESMQHKKLQKLCYYYVAWGYALYNKKLVENDEFQAWVHGPVSKELYDKYKNYGWQYIPIKEFNKQLDPDEFDLLGSIWMTYGDMSGNELEALTHTELPWISARAGLGDYDLSNNIVDVNIMKEYYSKIYEANQGE